MSEGLNRWCGMGNLAADAELRVTGGGQSVLKLRLACNESYLDKNNVRQERTEFVRITLFGRRAEALGKILSKGDRIYAEGRLQTSSYEDSKTGEKKYSTEVVATNIILAGGGRSGGQSQREPAPSQPTGGGGVPLSDDEIPF